jgi:hypothetical protein
VLKTEGGGDLSHVAGHLYVPPIAEVFGRIQMERGISGFGGQMPQSADLFRRQEVRAGV